MGEYFVVCHSKGFPNQGVCVDQTIMDEILIINRFSLSSWHEGQLHYTLVTVLEALGKVGGGAMNCWSSNT